MSHFTPYPLSADTLSRSHLRRWLSAHRWLTAAFIILFITASAARLVTFDRWLPYLDYEDENNMYLLARDWRGVEEVPVIPEWLAGYPPLYIWVNSLIQQGVEALWREPWLLESNYYYYTRLFAAFIGIITTFVIASIGWQLAGPIAGWLAGLVWGLSPVIVQHNSLAIPDPLVYLACAVSLTGCLSAWRKNAPGWLLAGLISALAALYLKYPALYIFLPWAMTALALIRRQPRRMLPWLALYALVFVTAIGYLVFDYGGLQLANREADTVRNAGLANMLDPARNLNNAYYAVYPIGMGLFLAVLFGALLAYAYSRRHGGKTLNWRLASLLLLYSLAGVVVTSSYSNVWLEAGKIRHVLPVSVALIPLWAAGVMQITWTLRDHLTVPVRSAPVVPVTAAVGLLLLSAIPGDLALIHEYQKQAIQQVLWRWSDANLPVDGLIMAHPKSRVAHTWNRAWSGYDGVKAFRWWFEDEQQIASSTPEDYIARGIRYFVLDERDQREFFNRKRSQRFIDQLTLVKTIPASPSLVGDTVYFYRLELPANPTAVAFGEQIQLAGYDLNAQRFLPGETLQLRPYWRILRAPESNYSSFVHLLPAGGGEIITQHDGPLSTAQRPTLTWNDPDELYIGGDIRLTIPQEIASGDYQLALGVYDYLTGVRLLTDHREDAVRLSITIR